MKLEKIIEYLELFAESLDKLPKTNSAIERDEVIKLISGVVRDINEEIKKSLKEEEGT